NLLVMDEPTNHLDLDSSEMLVEALQEFDGTLIFVSHNRSFINGLATHVWEVKERGVESHLGNLDDWRARQPTVDAGAERSAVKPPRTMSDKERRRLEAEKRQRLSALTRPLKEEIAKLEARIEELETTLAEIAEQLADPSIYDDFEKVKPLTDA